MFLNFWDYLIKFCLSIKSYVTKIKLVGQKVEHKRKLILFLVKRDQIRDDVCTRFDFLLCNGKIWFVDTFDVAKLREKFRSEFRWQLAHIGFWNTCDSKSINKCDLNFVRFYVNDSSTLPLTIMFHQTKLVYSEEDNNQKTPNFV